MITHRMKTRRHLRSARVAALTPDERRDEIRAAEARCAAQHSRAGQAGVDPAGTTGREPQGSSPDSHVI